MREAPKLPNSAVKAALSEHYGISVRALTFLPIGNDSASYVYRADAGAGTRYFLKLRRRSGFSAASLAVPRFLSEQGIPHIVTPLPTVTQALWVHVDDFALSLYPFIEARTATEAGLAEEDWHELGKTLHKIHASQLPARLQQVVPKETFIPSRRDLLRDLEPVLSDHGMTDPVQRELAIFWRSRQEEIRALIGRADSLGEGLRQAPLPRVLCHADLHTWNVLLDSDQRMWMVDWDETVLAPKERDLMFVIGGIARGLVSEHETARFLQGYGNPSIDQQALLYYRYAWAVQDMAAYAEEVFSSERSAQVRRAALRGFTDLFAPGNIVEIALSEGGSS